MDHQPPQVVLCLCFALSSAPAVLKMLNLPPSIFVLCWTDFGLDYPLVALSELFGSELFTIKYDMSVNNTTFILYTMVYSGVPREGGFGVFNPPSPKFPKALQNRAKLNPIVKTIKNCWI